MATIKAIDAKSVHQIQSGQVIVDLCSVVKELVENSLDAGATAIEVRFKNHGLDAIEVQDNGSGISSENYENVALKHYTSKLSSYDDLAGLQSFGFRGEALSSLCALSKFSVTTAQEHEAPKGSRLTFAISGKLDETSVAACQKGTTAVVKDLFHNLPVRRKELTKNIKREYGKVLGLLHAYACISVNLKLSVKNAMPKGKSMVVFNTQANATTRENIANVYGAKTLAALVPLDLRLELQPDLSQTIHANSEPTKVHLVGHISRPVFGEGRQAPDRQMFFVNGRPCGLPQIAKAINEVYKSFNVSQSPFIFADFHMDTDSYDVNVSPDKRTILLHNVASLVETLKAELTAMFDDHEQTVPKSQAIQAPQALQKPFQIPRLSSNNSAESIQPLSPCLINQNRTSEPLEEQQDENSGSETDQDQSRAFQSHFQHVTSTRKTTPPDHSRWEAQLVEQQEKRARKIAEKLQPALDYNELEVEIESCRQGHEMAVGGSRMSSAGTTTVIADLNKKTSLSRRQESADRESSDESEEFIPGQLLHHPGDNATKKQSGSAQDAINRAISNLDTPISATQPFRHDTFTTSRIPPMAPNHNRGSSKDKSGVIESNASVSFFSQRLQKFGASQSRMDDKTDPKQKLGSQETIDDQQSESSSANSDGNSSVDDEEDDANDPTSIQQQTLSQSDPEYEDEQEQKEKEAARVAELIRNAEDAANTISVRNLKRANNVLKPGQGRDSTVNLLTNVDISIAHLTQACSRMCKTAPIDNIDGQSSTITFDEVNAESKLDLTVSKTDFADMEIIGQFNLGFILAVRPSHRRDGQSETTDRRKDELFIIDQHASDEKYNFERLQNETVVGTQRLVRPGVLDLTAVEEEIVLEHLDALEKNGFIVEVDVSGESPVGRRCRLISLPLSKEVVFNSLDLEELIHLLSEAPSSASASSVPRPSKVRKMFAMRACRSSIMIGKTLSRKQMSTVVRHMGVIDKPWNCPHGRPTMRHLTSLDALRVWKEGDGVAGESASKLDMAPAQVWRDYML